MRIHLPAGFCSVAAAMMLAAALPVTGAAQVSNPSDAPLRPGDRILIRVWADSAFSDSARVDQVSHVALPIVGRVAIGGLPAPVLIDSIRAVYARSLRGSAVEVIPLRRITLSGELNQPGVYFLEPQVTLREAIAMAGGITEIGSGRIQVSRDSTRTSIRDWTHRSDAATIIQSGDVVWVPRQNWLQRNVLGAVSAAGVIVSIVLSLQRN